MKHRYVTFTAILLVLGCAGFPSAPKLFGVSPPPDGGYPGGNTAEGQNALFSLTTGGYNTAVGYLSLRSDTTNSFNTAIGAGTLLANTADENTAIGAGALLSNTTGLFNTATGAFALVHNTTGSGNTADGEGALLSNTTGHDNTANGFDALLSNTDGISNTAIGSGALQQNAGNSLNTAIGTHALFSNDGAANTAVGNEALAGNSIGSGNTAVGDTALFNNVEGDGNTAIGQFAGQNVDGAFNICIGDQVFGNSGESGTIHIGDSSNPSALAQNCYIAGIFNATSVGGTPVYVNSTNHLGTVTSSARFKDNIRPMDKVSEALFALKPVSFRYKKEIDPAGTAQLGLVAEDVEKVNPDLVVRDEEGKPYSVRYDQVNAMLLNEFLKEHKKVQEQQTKITKLESTVGSLVATAREQATQIQTISGQAVLRRPAAKEIAANRR
jgi:hypothetical protein